MDDAIKNVLDYIDQNIRDDFDIDTLASFAGFSRYHFCRVFQWATGYSPIAYVRWRKMVFAAAELYTGQRIIDIAAAYGFDTHSGFSKAFKRQFGSAPDQYRRRVRDIPIMPPAILPAGQYNQGGIMKQPDIIQKPAIRLAGYAIRTTMADGQNTKDVPAFWQAYMRDGRMQKLHAMPGLDTQAEYGACFPIDPAKGDIEYVIGLQLKEGSDAPAGLTAPIIPAGTYAVFSTPAATIDTFVGSIQNTWNYIFSEWFPASGYEFTEGGVDYELYDERSLGETDKVIDICIPVTPKE